MVFYRLHCLSYFQGRQQPPQHRATPPALRQRQRAPLPGPAVRSRRDPPAADAEWVDR